MVQTKTEFVKKGTRQLTVSQCCRSKGMFWPPTLPQTLPTSRSNGHSPTIITVTCKMKRNK